MELWNTSQEIRRKSIEDGQAMAFLNGKCGCGKVLGVFDSKTQKLLMNISENDERSVQEIYQELVRARNKLNRQISTLKKQTLQKSTTN